MERGFPSDWLADLSIVAMGIGALAVMLISAGAGHLIRNVQKRRSPQKVRESGESVAQEGYLIGSMLGLLGLILAFSFGMVLTVRSAARAGDQY